MSVPLTQALGHMSDSDATEELSTCGEAGFICLTSTREFGLVIRLAVSDPERTFEISWPEVFAYASCSDHFRQWDGENVSTSKHPVRTYANSKFLEFVSSTTVASVHIPIAIVHYQILSLYQIIDVAAPHPPRIRRVNV